MRCCACAVCSYPHTQVDVEFKGASRNRTWSLGCTEGAINLDASGSGAATYVCTFANSSAANAVRFNATGRSQCACYG